MKCTVCEAEESQHHLESELVQRQLFIQANSAMQRGPKPPKKPNLENYKEILHNIIVLLAGGLLTKIMYTAGKGQDPRYVSKGQPQRYEEMDYDRDNLYIDHPYESNPHPGGKGSWEGHQKI